MKRRRNRRCWCLYITLRLVSTLRSSVRERLRNAPFGGNRHFRMFSSRSSEERRRPCSIRVRGLSCEQPPDNCECHQRDILAHIACRQFEPRRELALAAEWTYKVPSVGEWWRAGPPGAVRQLRVDQETQATLRSSVFFRQSGSLPQCR